ncbi:MAG: tetratricopeptide repeat protein [Magnetococcales bacterium]|nr:tetratricopeptide repeat protein [Magnetococcales bacterium]
MAQPPFTDDTRPVMPNEWERLDQRLDRLEKQLVTLLRVISESAATQRSRTVSPEAVVEATRHKNRAITAMRERDGLQAEGAARAAVEACPDSADVLFTLAWVLHETGQLAEAESRYRQVLETAPKHASAWFNLGNVLERLNHGKEGIDAWRTAARLGHEGASRKLGATLRESPPPARDGTTPTRTPSPEGHSSRSATSRGQSPPSLLRRLAALVTQNLLPVALAAVALAAVLWWITLDDSAQPRPARVAHLPERAAGSPAPGSPAETLLAIREVGETPAAAAGGSSEQSAPALPALVESQPAAPPAVVPAASGSPSPMELQIPAAGAGQPLDTGHPDAPQPDRPAGDQATVTLPAEESTAIGQGNSPAEAQSQPAALPARPEGAPAGRTDGASAGAGPYFPPEAEQPPSATRLPAEPENRSPRLTVKPEPASARVQILNIPSRYQHGMTLEPGPYHVMVSHPGYQTVRKWVSLRNSDLLIPITLEKEENYRLRVITDPPDARVRILNIMPSYEPDMRLPAGKYQLEISHPEYRSAYRRVEVDDKDIEVRVKLIPFE